MDLKCIMLSEKKPDSKAALFYLYDILGKAKLQGQRTSQQLPSNKNQSRIYPKRNSMKEFLRMMELVAVTQINTLVKNKTVQQRGKFYCMPIFLNLKKCSYANIMGLGQTHDHILTPISGDCIAICLYLVQSFQHSVKSKLVSPRLGRTNLVELDVTTGCKRKGKRVFWH